jgi:hypothetical protein
VRLAEKHDYCLLNYLKLVYEPFLGSGTTLIAAQSCGRVCLGIEIDPLFVDLAIRRWQAFTGEKASRERDGALFEMLDQEAQSASKPHDQSADQP